MKKFLFSVAILAAAASCSKNEVVEIPSTAEIGFATLNNRITKAANDGDSNYQVYAYVTDGTAYNTTPYINEEIVGTTATNNHYYWPTATGSAVNFYAAAPVPATADEGAANAHLFSFTVPGDAAVDFTVAGAVKGATCTPTGAATANFTPASTASASYVDAGTVKFKFFHMLSKAMINVKLADNLKANYEFTFDKATFTVDLNSVALTKYESTKGEPIPGTSTASSTITDMDYDYDKYLDDSTPAVVATMGTTYAKTFVGTQDLFFAQQDGEDCKIVLTGVKVKDTETDQEIFNGNLTYDLSSSYAFNAGFAYLFTITIDKDKTNIFEILFDSTLDTWGTGAGVTID